MPELGIYLFAVAVSDQFGRPLGGTALPPEYGPVEVIAVDDMVALGSVYDGPSLSEIPPADIVRYLMLHQQVIENAARCDQVLPVRLGTVVRDEAEVRQLLRAGSDLIHQTATRFAGQVEIDVALTWDLDEQLQEVAGDAEVLAAKAAVAESPAEQRAELVLAVGRLVAARLDSRRAGIHRRLIDALRPHVREFQDNALVNDTLVCNTACLVRKDAVPAFDSALTILDSGLAGRYNFRRVGPLPLYSFATLHLRELGQERLEAAQELLGLAGDYDVPAVDQNFRTLAVALHPDANPGDDTAADRFEQLARARADLVTACRNRGAEAAPGRVRYFSVERNVERN